MVCICDNSSTHHTYDALVAMDDCFDGFFSFSPTYSPDLKPIEKGFSNVKGWLKDHEDDALLDPIGTINRAFHLYSTLGERSNSARGNWRLYFFNFGVH